MYFYFAVLAGVFAILWIGYMHNQLSLELTFDPSAYGIVRSAAVQFDFGNGTKRRFMGAIADDTTVAEVITAAARAGGLSLVWQGGDITAVGNMRNARKEWRVYRNDLPLIGDARLLPVFVRDQIELKYE